LTLLTFRDEFGLFKVLITEVSSSEDEYLRFGTRTLGLEVNNSSVSVALVSQNLTSLRLASGYVSR